MGFDVVFAGFDSHRCGFFGRISINTGADAGEGDGFAIVDLSKSKGSCVATGK